LGRRIGKRQALALAPILAARPDVASRCGPLIGNNRWKRKPSRHVFRFLADLIRAAKKHPEATESLALTTLGVCPPAIPVGGRRDGRNKGRAQRAPAPVLWIV